MSNLKIIEECQKCPEIAGNTWCNFKKCAIWKNDKMCEHGYLARIEKGIDMCNEIKDDQERFDKIMNQVVELEKLWEAKFGGKDKHGHTKIPF